MLAAALPLMLALGAMPGAGPPYETQLLANCGTLSPTRVQAAVSVDLDGDGLNELVYGCQTGLLVLSLNDGTVRNLTQFNLPPEFVAPGGRVFASMAADLDLDGRPEVLATARNAAGTRHRLWVLDVLAERIVLEVELPVGLDRRPDGIWDGEYEVAGVLPGPAAPLIVAAGTTGYDKLPRGLLAVDARHGDLVWTFASAANLMNHVVADLDGDGRPELVSGEGSGDNLDSETVRGRSDDESWLVVVDAAGSLLWERRLGPYFTNVLPAVCDLDGDGAPEVIAATSSQHPDFANQVTVFSGARGDTLAIADLGPTCRAVHAWRDPVAGTGSIMCALNDGRVLRLDYDEGRLQLVQSRRLPGAVFQMVAADMLPEAGPEFLLHGIDRKMHLLSAELRPLAELADFTSGQRAGVWDAGPEAILMYANGSNSGQRLVPVPAHRRFARPAGAAVLLLGAGLTAVTLARQRRRLHSLRRSSRRDLLRAFLTSHHGTVGPVGVLERVLWAAEHPELGGAARLEEAWTAARAEAVPDLQVLLDKAAHIRLDPPLLAIVRRELARLGGIYDELAGLAPDARQRDDLLRKARTSLGLVADGVRSLGATLSASSHLDPLPVVRAVVERYRQRSAQVAFDLRLGDEEPELHCHADAVDLEFALDNLLDNAVRQTAAAAAAAIAVTMAADSRRVTVTVEDNGPGVPAAERERIFAAGVSTRPGGGVGLWHSREALRYFGGDLTVEDAAAGGASFTITLRVAGN